MRVFPFDFAQGQNDMAFGCAGENNSNGNACVGWRTSGGREADSPLRCYDDREQLGRNDDFCGPQSTHSTANSRFLRCAAE